MYDSPFFADNMHRRDHMKRNKNESLPSFEKQDETMDEKTEGVDFGEQEDFGNVELGIGGYVSFRFGIHRLSLEARYAMLDFNPSKPRLTVSLSYNYSIPLKRVTAN